MAWKLQNPPCSATSLYRSGTYHRGSPARSASGQNATTLQSADLPRSNGYCAGSELPDASRSCSSHSPSRKISSLTAWFIARSTKSGRDRQHNLVFFCRSGRAGRGPLNRLQARTVGSPRKREPARCRKASGTVCLGPARTKPIGGEGPNWFWQNEATIGARTVGFTRICRDLRGQGTTLGIPPGFDLEHVCGWSIGSL
jgi:hypothetical protein